MTREVIHRLRPVGGHAFCNGNARLGVMDRGRKECFEAQFAPVFRQAAEGVNRTRDADGIGRVWCDHIAFGAQFFSVDASGCAA